MKHMSLDHVGIAEGTDKHSLNHDYLRHYERMFQRFQHEPIDILEIGVFEGSSLRTWRRFFSRARIIGIDVDPNCARYADENIIVEIGSQEDPAFCAHLCQTYRPTIIIDDGSHQAFDIEFTFERLFPSLLPGGCYVVEDVHFHFGASAERHSVSAPMPLVDYLNRMQRWLLGETLPDDVNRGFNRWFARTIDRIEIVSRAAAIWKRNPRSLDEEDFNQIEEAVAASQTAGGWHQLAGQLIMHGKVERAEQAARRAIELNARDWEFHLRLAIAMELKRDLEGAKDTLITAIELTKDDPTKRVLQARLEAIRARCGDIGSR